MKYLNPKIFVKNTSNGKRGLGLFTKKSIRKGELICDLRGEVKKYTKEKVKKLPKRLRNWCYEIDDAHELCPKDFQNPAPLWFVNHSCDPSIASLPDVYKSKAIRNIKPGNELTYDYSTFDSGSWKLKCLCGSKRCRKVIRGDDWMRTELQKRYKGYFQKNIQKKIDALKNKTNP